jgi:hypothetical protein
LGAEGGTVLNGVRALNITVSVLGQMASICEDGNELSGLMKAEYRLD